MDSCWYHYGGGISCSFNPHWRWKGSSNYDTSLVEFVRSEETITSEEVKGELLLDEHSDHTYAAKEQPFENEKICTLEFDCHADFFLAPLEGTEQLITQYICNWDICSEWDTQWTWRTLPFSHSPFQTLCNLLQGSINDTCTYILSCTDTEICIVELYHFSCKEMSIKLSDIIHSNIINECLIIKILFIPGMSFVLLYLGLIIEKGWNDV